MELYLRDGESMKSEFVGVTSGYFRYRVDWLKKELLLFDKVGIIKLEHFISELKKGDPEDVKTAERLIEEGIIFQPKLFNEYNNPHVDLFYEQMLELARKNESYYTEIGKDDTDPHNLIAVYIDIFAMMTRVVAYALQLCETVQAVCIDKPKLFEYRLNGFKNADAARIVVGAFPVISDCVPFSAILALRSDEEFKTHRRRLRSWIRKIGNDDLSTAELRDEIEYLMNEYQRYMRIQKLKFSIGTVESLVKMSLGIFENLLKLNLEKISDTIFSISKEKVNLAEAEINAPGKELSYLVKVSDELQKLRSRKLPR